MAEDEIVELGNDNEDFNLDLEADDFDDSVTLEGDDEDFDAYEATQGDTHDSDADTDGGKGLDIGALIGSVTGIFGGIINSVKGIISSIGKKGDEAKNSGDDSEDSSLSQNNDAFIAATGEEEAAESDSPEDAGDEGKKPKKPKKEKVKKPKKEKTEAAEGDAEGSEETGEKKKGLPIPLIVAAVVILLLVPANIFFVMRLLSDDEPHINGGHLPQVVTPEIVSPEPNGEHEPIVAEPVVELVPIESVNFNEDDLFFLIGLTYPEIIEALGTPWHESTSEILLFGEKRERHDDDEDTTPDKPGLIISLHNHGMADMITLFSADYTLCGLRSVNSLTRINRAMSDFGALALEPDEDEEDEDVKEIFYNYIFIYQEITYTLTFVYDPAGNWLRIAGEAPLRPVEDDDEDGSDETGDNPGGIVEDDPDYVDASFIENGDSRTILGLEAGVELREAIGRLVELGYSIRAIDSSTYSDAVANSFSSSRIVRDRVVQVDLIVQNANPGIVSEIIIILR